MSIAEARMDTGSGAQTPSGSGSWRGGGGGPGGRSSRRGGGSGRGGANGRSVRRFPLIVGLARGGKGAPREADLLELTWTALPPPRSLAPPPGNYCFPPCSLLALPYLSKRLACRRSLASGGGHSGKAQARRARLRRRPLPRLPATRGGPTLASTSPPCLSSLPSPEGSPVPLARPSSLPLPVRRPRRAPADRRATTSTATATGPSRTP